MFYYFFFVFEAGFAEDFTFGAVCDAAFDFAAVFAAGFAFVSDAAFADAFDFTSDAGFAFDAAFGFGVSFGFWIALVPLSLSEILVSTFDFTSLKYFVLNFRFLKDWRARVISSPEASPAFSSRVEIQSYERCAKPHRR